MNEKVARLVFKAIDRARHERIFETLDFLKVTQYWSHEKIQDLQQRKLRRLITHAFEHVPFYRQRMLEAGLSASLIQDTSTLKLLPLLNKADVQTAGDRIRLQNLGEPIYSDTTSGSTGTPMRFVKNAAAFGWQRAHALRGLQWYGVDPGASQARIWGIPLSLSARRREIIKDWVLNRRRYSPFSLDSASLDAILQKIVRQKPVYLYGYSSAIHLLTQHIMDRGASHLGNWRPRVVVTTAEVLFPDQAADISNVFDCPVANEYGASELTMIAYSCPHGTLHVSDESVLVEFEPSGIVIKGKEAFRLILTDLNNFAQPFIRYRIGDLGRPVKECCPCGRTLSRIELLGGREVDVLHAPSGRVVHGSIFSYIGKSILVAAGTHRFRVTYDQPGHLNIEIETSKKIDRTCLMAMEHSIKEQTGEPMEISFHLDAEILPEKSGKLRYFVNNMQK
jgi:phenylacetate-CoA ligase